MTAKIQPSKKAWQDICAALEGPYNSVRLLIDGHEIKLLSMMVKRRLVVMVTIDGQWKEWLGKPLATKFFRRVEEYEHSAKTRAANLKEAGGKRAPAYVRDRINQKVTRYDPTWPTVAPLKRHLIAHAESIQVLEIDVLFPGAQ